MNIEFIPYEQSSVLKELGFDEECFAYYDNNNIFIIDRNSKIEHKNTTYLNNELFKGVVLAPLYQQAFRWFREKYNLKGHVEAVEYLDLTPDTYHWCIFNKCNSGYDLLTHEESELECLKKLIEIVKQ